MKLKAVVLVTLAASVTSLPTVARGAGYSIYEQGAAALGMAGVGVAGIHDGSALFFNPAALTTLPGTQVYVGGSLLSPVTSFAGDTPYPGLGVTEEMKRRQFFPPTLYATHRCASKWAVGAGLNAPFGLGIQWKDPFQFTGRYIATHADLTTLNGMLSAAYAINPQWGVAGGANALFAKVKLTNTTLAIVPGGGGALRNVAETTLESKFKPGYGWNVAVSGTPAKEWRLGAAYRSKVIVDVDDGTADFRQIATGNLAFDAAVAAGLPPDQAVSTVLRFPATWSAGLAWLPTEAWTVEADFNFFEWSVFSDLPIRFHQTAGANTTLIEDYNDSFQIRAGAEHRLKAYTYRFGYYFDQAAAPDESLTPILPDADRHGISLGFGKRFGRWSADVYELAIIVPERSTNHVERDGFDGTYKTYVNAAGFGLGYHW